MKEVEGEEGGERGQGALVGNHTRGLFGLKPKVSKTDHIPINSPVLLSPFCFFLDFFLDIVV